MVLEAGPLDYTTGLLLAGPQIIFRQAILFHETLEPGAVHITHLADQRDLLS